MAHLKKSSTGHLLKSVDGHLVNDCGEPVSPGYRLDQCNIACANEDCDGTADPIFFETTGALSNLNDAYQQKIVRYLDKCWIVSILSSPPADPIELEVTGRFGSCELCCDPCGFNDGMSYPRDNDAMEFSVTFNAAGIVPGDWFICDKFFLCGGSLGAFPTFYFGSNGEFEEDCEDTDPGKYIRDLVWNYNPSGAGGDTNWRFRQSESNNPYSFPWRRGSDGGWDIIQDDVNGFEWVNGTSIFLYASITITNNPCENPGP